ncbi:LLM class flavin-dependent oxidoreductase [Novosphingobium fluoreni]|uniref:LLM class flavin-dependent oxidoreductase n=1 Tax=Novosphingobium fluoreni TaxID=1391222 RepID=UPI003D9FC020
MKVGVQAVVYPGFVPVLEQARAVEGEGFASFFCGEHHHYPESTPVPEFYKETGVPDFYRSAPDPLITLGAVTAVAPKLLVGTSILLLPIHDPLTLANRIATVADMASGKASLAWASGGTNRNCAIMASNLRPVSTGRMKSWWPSSACERIALHRMTETS